jgi:hypothetical protein
MTLARIDNPITAMTATLSVADLDTLAEGLHPIAIQAQDSLGNWGTEGTITLTLDRTGPAAPTPITLTPNTLDLSGAPPVTAVRLDATIVDAMSAGAQSALANAEGFIDTIGPDGTGFDLFPSDGLFDEVTEDAYFDIPIASFLYRAQGDHSVYVHGLDASGNWGVFGEAIITIDRGAVDAQGPVIEQLTITFNPAAEAATAGISAGSVSISAEAADPGLLSNVAGAEWFVDTDPGEGAGTPLQATDGVLDLPRELLDGTLDVSGWGVREYTFYVRGLDSSGFWGPTASAVVRVDEGGTYFLYLPLVVSNP